MAQIAKHAGVSKGTPYNYFQSKPVLFAAFVEEEVPGQIEWIFELIDPEANVAGALADIARRWIRYQLSEPVLTLDRIVISEAANFPCVARGYLKAGHLRCVDRLACWFDAQSRIGSMDIDHPWFAAEQFLALCKTRLWMQRCFSLRGDATDAEIDFIADKSVSMFLKTYGSGAIDSTSVDPVGSASSGPRA